MYFLALYDSHFLNNKWGSIVDLEQCLLKEGFHILVIEIVFIISFPFMVIGMQNTNTCFKIRLQRRFDTA